MVTLNPSEIYDGDIPSPLTYCDRDGNIWTWNAASQSWIKTGFDAACDINGLGKLLNTNSQLLRTSKRRKNSNRIFKFTQTSDQPTGTPDKDKPLFGDVNDVSSTDLPFNE